MPAKVLLLIILILFGINNVYALPKPEGKVYLRAFGCDWGLPADITSIHLMTDNQHVAVSRIVGEDYVVYGGEYGTYYGDSVFPDDYFTIRHKAAGGYTHTRLEDASYDAFKTTLFETSSIGGLPALYRFKIYNDIDKKSLSVFFAQHDPSILIFQRMVNDCNSQLEQESKGKQFVFDHSGTYLLGGPGCYWSIPSRFHVYLNPGKGMVLREPNSDTYVALQRYFDIEQPINKAIGEALGQKVEITRQIWVKTIDDEGVYVAWIKDVDSAEEGVVLYEPRYYRGRPVDVNELTYFRGTLYDSFDTMLESCKRFVYELAIKELNDEKRAQGIPEVPVEDAIQQLLEEDQ